MNIAIVSLGCPKNQVDADRFCRALLEAGHQTVPEATLADIVIINTCGFIESAKEEAIEEIFNACAIKKQNPNLVVIAAGCLAERYSKELAKEIPELDAVVGIGQNGRLPQIVEEVLHEKNGDTKVYTAPKQNLPLEGRRVISTPPHYAWLKISDGCSNKCSYCAIPAIRGPLRSRQMENVILEAQWLAQQGVKELVLVAQDVTAYGEDLGQNAIAPLLYALNKIDGLQWIRLLYAYPERIGKELLLAMRENSKVVPYLDLPIQHCNEEILESMGRRGGAKAVKDAIALIKKELPNAVLRTSLIAGYPGETQEQFEELCRFVSETGFERLGCFAYSEEEGTRAAKMPNQLPQQERRRRADSIMQLQSHVMAAKQQKMVGKKVLAICDAYDEEEKLWLCRTKADAPEIDANVLVDGKAKMQVGNFYTLSIKSADEYDLYADECVKEEGFV